MPVSGAATPDPMSASDLRSRWRIDVAAPDDIFRGFGEEQKG